MQRFAGKVIVVTGAASGIGAATARRLYDEGATVIAVDLKQPEAATVEGAQDEPERWVPMATDISEPTRVADLFAAVVKRFGHLHGLVNSAGIRGVGNILDVKPEELNKVLAVNLAGTLFMCQSFARAGTEGGYAQECAIVNVTSAGGIRAVPNRLTYVASKFGVVGITQTMALELAPTGMRVNAVAPGTIRTPMSSSMFQDPENVKRINAAHPLGRAGEPEEIAAAIAFLLSEDASYITGAVLAVDGGMTVGIPSFGGRQ